MSDFEAGDVIERPDTLAVVTRSGYARPIKSTRYSKNEFGYYPTIAYSTSFKAEGYELVGKLIGYTGEHY